MFATIPEDAPAETINNFDQEQQRAILEFGLRLEVMGFMVCRNLVDLETINEMAGGTVIGFWSRAGNWAIARRGPTGHGEFLEWCEWLAQRLSTTNRRIFVVRQHTAEVPACSTSVAGMLRSGVTFPTCILRLAGRARRCIPPIR